ncbi:hypothetical protein PtA15_8A610 [Puccinia triticina]|uniref:Uncharacterized protein n=1 Tax=Puccinia triticina TaxID=208348 RepID=A0ABY7CR10_9BASI|nr:uncharacterized protein PtA15_8A610 [Puccinia triticina]WAQ87704.1 hypothetical protein PtA15_8A610 [Puccinia triticina]WAR57585.1 hypothetical protein PtB15_8B637 [Puccinia triticina]
MRNSLCNRHDRPNGKTLATAERLAIFLHQTGLMDNALIDNNKHWIGWKFVDAELVVYHILIILGHQWLTVRQV